MYATTQPAAPVELTAAEIDAVSGGSAAHFLAGALIVGALVVTAAVIHDNATNGPLADAWYKFTK
mgnify:CR=1 FL=1